MWRRASRAMRLIFRCTIDRRKRIGVSRTARKIFMKEIRFFSKEIFESF